MGMDPAWIAEEFNEELPELRARARARSEESSMTRFFNLGVAVREESREIVFNEHGLMKVQEGGARTGGRRETSKSAV
jgi:hypothetical protein